MSSIRRKAFKSASWLALFKFLKQVSSWSITILVARILVPGDYGLMEMATVLTGYAAMFSELGIGAAIIHKSKLSQNELSSIFWFSFGVSLLLALICYGLAYPTALIFNDPRVIPVTKLASVNFILNGLQIVPLNLLKKELEFKKIGMLELMSTIVSCVSMYFMARIGAGVWTLIGGRVIYCFISLIMVYYFAHWFPKYYFAFKETKSLIQFGIVVAFSRSFFYVYEKSDRFFAGRAWTAVSLGYYSFALQLSQMPTEKIVSLINQVSFAVFSKLQNDTKEFNKFYLDITKLTLALVIPIFVGGYLFGDDLVKIFLGEKWLSIVIVFKYMCLVQIMTSLTAVNSFVHAAQGRPHFGLVFNVICAILMPISFFLAVPYGLNAMLVPWLTIYLFVCLCWIGFTLHTLEISFLLYLKNIQSPLLSVLFMFVILNIFGDFNFLFPLLSSDNILVILFLKIALGAVSYFLILFIFDKSLVRKFIKLRQK